MTFKEIMDAVKQLASEAYIQGVKDGREAALQEAARVAENCEVCLEPDDMFGNAQIAAAIRSLPGAQG